MARQYIEGNQSNDPTAPEALKTVTVTQTGTKNYLDVSVGAIALPAGAATEADGALPVARAGRSGEAIFQELHGRFYEQNFRSLLYSDGMGLTAISNATYTTATLTASVTPIVGVWNPSTSGVNLVILQATLGVTQTALQSTGGGPYVWAMSTGNTAISTGTTPLNRKTLVKSGSAAKGMTNTTPTGLTNSLVVMHASSLGGGSGYNTALLGTAIGYQPGLNAFTENIDGGLIVPPGGFLALLATTTPVAHSAASSLLWEEVAV